MDRFWRISTVLILSLLSSSLFAQVQKTERGVTFVVDEGLEPMAWKFRPDSSHYLAKRWMDVFNPHDPFAVIQEPEEKCLACSFDGDKLLFDNNALFSSMLDAYQNHRQLELSPDMIWLNTCQVFAHYVRTHVEEMRGKLVDHDGKMELIVETEEDIMNSPADWNRIIGMFSEQITQNTKGDIADILKADFSTTGLAERAASEITLMDALHPYFEYILIYAACGIPSITLTGTPDDWRKVLEKTESLDNYGMSWYTVKLKPILKEFILASEGKPNRRFWQSIVMKTRPEKLQGPSCGKRRKQPTVLTGWFTDLFPYDSEGKKIARFTIVSQVLNGMAKVNFKAINARTWEETPMNFYAGFVGMAEDPETGALAPKIGWMATAAVRAGDEGTGIR